MQQDQRFWHMRLFVFLFLMVMIPLLPAESIQRSGAGFLEVVEGQQVLHLKGSPYELGVQHGELLKEQISRNVARFVDQLEAESMPPVVKAFMANVPEIIPFIPAALIAEMQGIAVGACVPYEKILLLNLFPEMFHCSGMTVCGQATSKGELYHVRVLDYGVGNGLQDTAILAVVKPQQGHAFVNVTYAGFIGSITGLNEQKIGVGEIGGKGYGSWKGLPMAFLLRCILEQTSSLAEVQHLLASTPRTCEYYYVFSDGKTKEAIGVYATADTLEYITPGNKTFNLLDKTVPLSPLPADTLVITRHDHYELILTRLMKTYGNTTVDDLQQIIKQPVAHATNLHNAIFAPASLEVWVSHAGPHNEPACDQPYSHFSLPALLAN